MCRTFYNLDKMFQYGMKDVSEMLSKMNLTVFNGIHRVLVDEVLPTIDR